MGAEGGRAGATTKAAPAARAATAIPATTAERGMISSVNKPEEAAVIQAHRHDAYCVRCRNINKNTSEFNHLSKIPPVNEVPWSWQLGGWIQLSVFTQIVSVSASVNSDM